MISFNIFAKRIPILYSENSRYFVDALCKP